MTKTERMMFRIAKNVSELSDHKQYHIGASIINKHRVISTGVNSGTKSNPIQCELNKLRFDANSEGHLHAEVSALLYLIKNKIDLSKAEIYTYRELKNGHIANARPCKACMALIKSCGIKKIHYTTYDGYAIEEI